MPWKKFIKNNRKTSKKCLFLSVKLIIGKGEGMRLLTFLNKIKSKIIQGDKKNKEQLLKAKYSKINRAISEDTDNFEKQEFKPVITEYVRVSSISNPSKYHSSISEKKLFKFPFENNLSKYFNIKSISAAAAVIVLVSYLVNASLPVNAYAVEVNGKTIATVAEKDEAEKLLQHLKTEKERLWHRKVSIEQKLAFENVRVRKYQIDNPIVVKNRLKKAVTFVATAGAIKVNGNIAVVLKDSKEAASVLQKLKDSYNNENIKVENVSFQESVEVVDVPVSLGEVVTDDKALKLLKEGKQEKKAYIVKPGDSLWTIARANDMHVADLIKMNPSLSEHLDLGQQINLVALEPMINVVLTGESIVKEEIPYKVVVKKDSGMNSGREKVKIQGQKGEKQVTYKLVMKNGNIISKNAVNEKLIKPAQDQVVIRGSKVMVASRSTGGKLSWPIFGRITSPFGRRWGEFHTGIDIDGVTGEPVGAAAGGVVIEAGRDGNYGKMVMIRHSNGLVTRYAHLSSINVSAGDNVSKGELIGRVGSTGRSTGSHLHFEVISGGKVVNPRKFLK